MERMKVIIAEDEPIVARYIKGILDDFGGFQIAAICETGDEAIVQCEKENPRLLITDIKMPGITGLELIERVKKNGADIRTIIISGFKSFDYAKQAIALGVEEYITKPINIEELRKTLFRIREEYLQEFSLEKGVQMENAMRSLDDAYPEKVFPYSRFQLLLAYQSGEIEDMDYQIWRGEETLTFVFQNVLFVLDGGQDKEASERMRKLMKEITLSRKRKKTCAVMKISKMEMSDECISNFRKLHRILREFVIPGKLICREYDSADGIAYQTKQEDEGLLKKLEIYITAKDWKKVSEGLNQLFDFWEKNRFSLYHMKIGIFRITDRLHKSGAFVQGKVFVNEYMDDCIRFADSYEGLKESVCGYLEDVLKAQSHTYKDGKGTEQLCESICQFVLQNEEKNFSLNEISSIFGISQPFIRKIFRTNLGVSYNEWVLKMKIDRAKELMRANPKMLVKDVAEKIGYEQLYFSTVFNKCVGMSPSEYRFQNHIGKEL